MDAFQSISLGFSVILTPSNIFFCFLGCFVGTLIGVLPGIGSTATVALLLPFSFNLPPVTAIIMLAGIFYGAMYGGSTTSILVNIPGEAASVVTCIDGYQMARQGRAGRALGIAAIGSFIAGTGGVILLMILAPPLARLALKFGPFEFFALIFFALTLAAYLTSGSMIKAFVMVAAGMIISTVGLDTVSGVQRFTLGIEEFYDGIGLVPVVMGVFGVGEILINLEETFKRDIFKAQIGGLLPDKKDMKASALPIVRGSLLGFFLSILPGVGASIPSFISYSVERRFSKHPEKFGKGAIEGVAGPESANNAACAGAFIPLFTFGIPTTATMALLLGAFLIHNVIPGPLLIRNNPDVFWGVILSMYMGNIILLILNLPLISIWVKLLRVPYATLFPLILLFCLIGAYANNGSLVDINVMIIFGLIGYLMRKTGFEAAPFIFAYVLCPIWEETFRRSLLLSGGDLLVFFKRPIPAILLSLAFIFILSSIFSSAKRRRLTEKLGEE
ncbi:MAG: tripartite tricarboxylate transporter permease [Thermodesulfobacteriota bacterium]|nr:tripartite tricarboxylate transporter permease [Thermodesulfobacteriota bacterium]